MFAVLNAGFALVHGPVRQLWMCLVHREGGSDAALQMNCVALHSSMLFVGQMLAACMHGPLS